MTGLLNGVNKCLRYRSSEKMKNKWLVFYAIIILIGSFSIFSMDATAQEHGSLEGYVRAIVNGSDTYLYGACVMLNQDYYAFSENGSGLYEFERVPVGNYNYTVQLPEYISIKGEIKIESGQNRKDFTLEKEEQDVEDNEMKYLRLIVHPNDAQIYINGEEIALNASGAYYIRLAPGDYYITSAREDWVLYTNTIQFPEISILNIYMNPTEENEDDDFSNEYYHDRIGPLYDEYSNPLSGVTVQLNYNSYTYTSLTDANGYAAFPNLFKDFPLLNNTIPLGIRVTALKEDYNTIVWQYDQGRMIPPLEKIEDHGAPITEGDKNDGVSLLTWILIAFFIVIIISVLITYLIVKRKRAKQLSTIKNKGVENSPLPVERHQGRIKSTSINQTTSNPQMAIQSPEPIFTHIPPPPPPSPPKGISKDSYKAHFSPPLPTPIPASMGYAIPNYTLTYKIGEGGFATVYQGKTPSDQFVAIKLPKFMGETLDSSIYDKFESEARIWSKLKHPNIVKIYESGVTPLPYIAMEFMDGGNLKQLMSNYRLQIDEATEIMVQILDGISYAHRMASVHRDLKPENILFTKNGITKITDWGIGKFMASESLTRTVGTKGTLAYSSPEQISKEKYGNVDWSTDVFQLGIIFYEMLTGRNPFFDEDPVTVMSNIINKFPDPPSSINQNIYPALDELILRSLIKRKEGRWRSADIMYQKLVEALRR